MAKIKAHITKSTDQCMEGAELQRLRWSAGLSQEQLAAKMKAWGWYRGKVARYEDTTAFKLDEQEMQALLESLGVV